MSDPVLHSCHIGAAIYWFRSPDVYDPARARRVLTLQRVRRPSQQEFEIAALEGIEKIAELAGDVNEGARQRQLLERFYELLKPIDENDLEEPDIEARAALLAQRQKERSEEIAAIYPEASAIQATLERHWQPYAELQADREYFDDVSRIDIVRLLLVKIGVGAVARGDDGLMSEAAYQMIPREHRVPLSTFAFRLLAPDESQRKN